MNWPREPEDVTGGFLFELEYKDRYAEEASGVVTQRGQPVVVKEPEEMSAAQGEYASTLLNSFERAIFAADGVDSETGRHYTEIADFDSLVRKYMIEEVCKNYDGNKSSQYFFKDSDAVDPLLYAGPVWDYDSAWGNYAREGSLGPAEPEGLSIARQGYDYSWWPALYRHQDFREVVRNVYETELAEEVNLSDIEVTADGKGAKTSVTLETMDGGVKALITVTAGDLKSNDYQLLIKGATMTTGIRNVGTEENHASERYSLNGYRLNESRKGLVIERNAKGVRKILAK